MEYRIDISDIVAIADLAGEEIMKIYASDFAVEHKEDRSPLTEADKRSHEMIVSYLGKKYPDIPILSEEGKDIPYDQRKEWKMYWLVDPLDGTKEFLKRNGEFTVNIALVEEDTPLLGVITAPARNLAYWAASSDGSHKRDEDGVVRKISVGECDAGDITLVESRSHPSKELEEYLKQFRIGKRISVGSSLKFCAVADGSADLYARLGPMMAWDVGAGIIISQAAGASVASADGKPIALNTPDLRIPTMVASHPSIQRNL